MRFDLGVQTFNSNTLIAYACPRPPLTCGATGGQGLTVVSSTANVVLTERPQERNSFYWMAGLGAYALNDGPYEGAYTRFGWNGGGGIRFGSNIVIEFRYHRLINPRTTRGFVPIAAGFHSKKTKGPGGVPGLRHFVDPRRLVFLLRRVGRHHHLGRVVGHLGRVGRHLGRVGRHLARLIGLLAGGGAHGDERQGEDETLHAHSC